MWDRFVASDPGLARLQMALRAATAVATTIGVEFGFTALMHIGGKGAIVSTLLGAVVSMMGTMALSITTGILANIRVASGFPIALGIGLVAGTFARENTLLMLSVFVIVMFIAVAVRRFGPPFFFYGFMGWMGYFFASFMHATLSVIPLLLIAIVIASAWVTLLSTTVLRISPERSLRRALSAYRSRARMFAGVCAELLRTPPGPERDKQLRRVMAQQIQLSEAALIVEGWSAEVRSLPAGWSGAAVRRYLLDAEHALDQLAASSKLLLELESEVTSTAADVAEFLALRNDVSAAKKAREIIQFTERTAGELVVHQNDTWRRLAVEQFAQAAVELSDLAIMSVLEATDNPSNGEFDEFEPVTGLFMGNLPGSPAVAAEVPARGTRWNPLARLPMPLRQAVQVAVAGALSILAGWTLSPQRYYWAVIAAFVMFTGTATRSETFLKGLNRVIGTLVGLVVSIWVAELTNGRVVWVLAVVIACIFCGFYLFRISYAFMIFFITIMIGQLYSVLHIFSPGLLVLRLEETAIGAVAGFVVALAVIPLSTRDTIRAARNNLLVDFSYFLQKSADRIQDPSVSMGELEAQFRTLDNRMQQLLLITRPLRRPFISASSTHVRHRLSQYASLVSGARALTVALREPVNTDANELGSICRDLAEAMDRLSKENAHDKKEPIAGQTKTEQILVHLDDPITDPILRKLLHIQRLLLDLAEKSDDPL